VNGAAPSQARRPILANLLIIFYSALGLSAELVGLHDAVSTTQLWGQAVGVLFAVAGLTLLLAAWSLLIRASWRFHASFFAAVSAAVLGFSLLVAQIKANPEPLRITAWLVLVALGLASGSLVFRAATYAPEVKRADWWHILIATPFPVILGLVPFMYNSLYVPSSLLPSLSVATSLKVDGEITKGTGTKNRLAVVEATATIENTTDAKALLLGSVYRVTAHWVGIADDTNLPERSGFPALDRRLLVESPNSQFNRHAKVEHSEVVGAGKVADDQIVLQPKQRYASTITTFLPPDEFDFARLSVDLYAAKGDLLRPQARPFFGPQRVSESWGHAVVTEWWVQDRSWLNRIITGRRYIISEWVTDYPTDGHRLPTPFLRVFLDRQGRCPEPKSDTARTSEQSCAPNFDLADKYGLQPVRSTYDLPLVPQKGMPESVDKPIKIKFGDDEIELSGRLSASERERLIRTLAQRYSDDHR
jgi:hypothetical protein